MKRSKTPVPSRPVPSHPVPSRAGGVQPWHLLVIGVLMSAAAGAVVTRDGGTVQTVTIVVMILTAGLVAAGVARTFGPLVEDEAGEETEMLAGRTRAALEREKMLVLRSIKEVEFDRAMRKMSDTDYGEIVPRLRTRAVGLIRQLEGGGGYRALIERDLAALMGTPTRVRGEVPPMDPGFRRGDDKLIQSSEERLSASPEPARYESCPACATVNDKDASFCKSCGTRLAGGV